MFRIIEPFGYHVQSTSIGEAWLNLVEVILNCGEKSFDEKRERLCLQNVRVRIERPELPDKLIDRYADKKKVEDIIYLTFSGDRMYDCDVKPSFSPGPRSYHARLKAGQMDEFVIRRLTKIPESKKAVMSFIHWNDYKEVLKKPHDDYLPCIVSIQFRLIERKDKYSMTVVFNSRSIDAFQKSGGNLIAIVLLAKKIESELNIKLEKKVEFELLDGMITDAHIYSECYKDAREVISKYKRDFNV